MGFGLNFINGAAAAYQGYKAEERRQSDDARRQKADERADQDASFREEERNRQRATWSEADRIKAADKADLAAVNEQFRNTDTVDTSAADQAAAQAAVDQDKIHSDIASAMVVPADMLPGVKTPSSLAADPNAVTYKAPAAAPAATSPKLASEVVAKMAVGGTARTPTNFNNTLERQSELLRRKLERGDLSPADYTQQTTALNHWRAEGMNDAIELMSRGDYDGAIGRFNSVGSMRGARLIKGEQGITKINGEDVPTHFVTIANGDGTQTVMDVAKARYQMLDLNSQLTHVDRARQATTQQEQFRLQREDNKALREQQRLDAQAGRSLQWKQLQLQQQQLNANTPIGQILAKEKALGQPLTLDQKANMLGVDAMPTQTRLQMTSLLKAQDQLSQAMNKAQSEGTWQPESIGARDMLVRSAMLNQQISDLMVTSRRPARDPAGILGDQNAPQRGATGGTMVPNPVQQDTRAPAASLLGATGGLRPSTPVEVSPVAKALGLSAGDRAMNGIVLSKAAKIEDAARAFHARKDEFLAASKSDDTNAIQTYQQRMQDAYKAVGEAIGPLPEPQQIAVLNAVGM